MPKMILVLAPLAITSKRGLAGAGHCELAPVIFGRDRTYVTMAGLMDLYCSFVLTHETRNDIGSKIP